MEVYIEKLAIANTIQNNSVDPRAYPLAMHTLL